MAKGSVKYNYEGIKELGYELIKEEYVSTGNSGRIKRYVTIKDNEGYLYRIIDSELKIYNPSRFHKGNPYTIENIKLFLYKIKFPYKLLSDKYLDARNNKLEFVDEFGYFYSSTWDGVLQGYIPTRFGNNSGKSNNQYAIQNIKLWLKLNNIDLELISDKYKNNQQNLVFKDKDDYYYTCAFANLSSGHLPRKFDASNKFTIQNIHLWCKLNNKPFKLLSNKYINNNDKLNWKCLKEGCEEEFEMNWADILSTTGCSYCSGRKVGLSNCLATKYPELAKEWHSTLNDDLTPYDITCGNDKEIWWQCRDNPNHVWSAIITNRVKNGKINKCPFCSHRLPSDDYNLLVYNPLLCEEWDYNKNNKNPEEFTPYSGKYVWWKCKECKHEWRISIYHRNKKGTGCPKCRQSKGEKKIENWINNYNIPFEKQYSFGGLVGIGGNPLLFDGCVFFDQNHSNIRLLIEYDGEGHYSAKPFGKKSFERTKIHDKFKNDYCIKNNIPLIRIPYWEFDNIETILTDILIHNNMDSEFIVNNKVKNK